MEDWEYCLLWASPKKTVVVKPGGLVETFSKTGRSQGILTDLQADGWQTVAYDIAPTVDMTYLFKRPVQAQALTTRDKPLSDVSIYPRTRMPYQQADTSVR